MTTRVINELKQRLLRRIPSINTKPIEKTVPYINTTPSKRSIITCTIFLNSVHEWKSLTLSQIPANFLLSLIIKHSSSLQLPISYFNIQAGTVNGFSTHRRQVITQTYA